jgi:hypothetical protein
MKLLSLVGSCALFSACTVITTEISPGNASKIGLCNAGSNVSLSANVEAKVGKNLQEGVKADAGIENELRGLFLNKANVTEANAVALYNAYVDCRSKATA